MPSDLSATSALLASKSWKSVDVSVCLPARDEAATLGPICARIASELMPAGLVDELIVMDSRSSDDTAEVAARNGARVERVDDVLPGHGGADGGKGEAMWKSLHVASGDVVVWIDADLRDFNPAFVTRLMAPLIARDDAVLVKGYFRRPVDDGAGSGGRVTELLVRPLLALLVPELGGVVQPLSGECAIRRAPALDIPFLSGYGVDIGLLLEVFRRHGLDAIDQVDLGERAHRNRDLQALGRTAHEVLEAALALLEDMGRLELPGPLPGAMTQFDYRDGAHRPIRHELGLTRLPPLSEIDPAPVGSYVSEVPASLPPPPG